MLASVCLGRQWNMRRGSVRGWVAAPAVIVQSNSGAAGLVAVAAGVDSAWLCGCWCRPLPSMLSLVLPLFLSLQLACLAARLNDESPAAAICSCGFPVCRVDVACLHISFTDIFVPENRPSSRSGSSSQLAMPASTCNNNTAVYKPSRSH